MMSEAQAEIKREASQSGCSACKKGLGSRAETRLRAGQEGWERVPSQPLCHAPPGGATSTAAPPSHSGFWCYFFPFGDTPGSLRSSQSASAYSNFHLFQLENLSPKGARNLSSCEAEQGDTDKQPLPRLGLLLRASFIIYQQHGHAQPSPCRAGDEQPPLAGWG